MLTILKLGGSVITKKDQQETVDTAALATASQVLSQYTRAGGKLILVHGGGSFGHHYADTYGVTSEQGTHDAEGILAIHQAMGELNEAVIAALHDNDVDGLPVRPLSVAYRSADGTVQFPSGQLETMLEEGFTPVINGDVIADATEGSTVLGGDNIVVTLAGALDADQVGLCSNVPGVLDDDDNVVPEIEAYEDVASVLGASDTTDVTGGMAGKISQLLELDAPASVFDLDSLETFLDTGTAGTVVW